MSACIKMCEDVYLLRAGAEKMIPDSSIGKSRV